MRPVSGLKILDLSEIFGPNFDIKGYKSIFFLVLFFDWPHRDGKSTMKPLCLMDISLVLYQDNTEFIQIYFPYNRKPYIYIYKSSPRGYSFYLLALQATSKSSLAQIVTCSQMVLLMHIQASSRSINNIHLMWFRCQFLTARPNFKLEHGKIDTLGFNSHH